MGMSGVYKIFVQATLACGNLSLTGTAFAAPCTVPNTVANGQIADASKLMDNFNAVADCAQQGITTTGAPANGSLPVFTGPKTIGTGNLSGDVTTSGTLTTTLSNTGVTPGSYNSAIIIVDAKGRITSAMNGAAGGGGSPLFVPPAASSFTLIDSAGSIAPTLTDIAGVGLAYSVPIGSAGIWPAAYQPAPTAAQWTWTVHAKYSLPGGSYPNFGVWLRDSGGRMIGEVLEFENGAMEFGVQHLNSSTAWNSNRYRQVFEAPTWFRVINDGTNLMFLTSWDGNSWMQANTEALDSFFTGNIQYIGFGGNSGISDTSLWGDGSTIGATIDYWNIH